LEIIGIAIAIIAALFVLIHARMRQLPFWSIVGWVAGTFLLLIIVLPIYLLIHGPRPKPNDDARETEDR
jgi:4-amino-4-deoxy-L-arabinose transferase-like glycosyltransferase